MGINLGKERLGHADISALEQAVRGVAPMSSEALGQLFSHLRVRCLPRGEYLLRAGEQAQQVAWVLSGLLREHYVLGDGRERTKAFISEGGLSGSAADLLRGHARAYIVAEEPTRLATLHVEDLRELSDGSAEWAAFTRRALERVLLAKAEREYELLALDAEGRYQRFAEHYPGLEASVAARHIASYLGITPVHLSRLRQRRRRV